MFSHTDDGTASIDQRSIANIAFIFPTMVESYHQHQSEMHHSAQKEASIHKMQAAHSDAEGEIQEHGMTIHD